MDKPTSAPAPRFYSASYDVNESIGLLMRRVMSSILMQADKRLVDHDLTHAQWVPLFKLFTGQCSTLATLSRDLQMDPGAMTRAIDRLEAKGLVRRERSATDRRVYELALTDDGQRQAAVVPGVLAEVLNAHLVGFTEAEWRQLVSFLQRMVANGEAIKADAQDAATSSGAIREEDQS